MLPRKRQRPNPAEASTSSLPLFAPSRETSTSQPAEAPESAGQRQMPPPSQSDTAPPASNGHKQVRQTQSWYGSWPRTPKAIASTSVARENIFGGTTKSNRASNLGRFDQKKDSDGTSQHSTAGTASSLSKAPETEAGTEGTVNSGEADADALMPDADTAETPTTDQPAETPATPQRPDTSASWLGWLSRTQFLESSLSATPPKPTDTVKETEAPRPSTPPEPTAPPESSSEDQSQEPPPSTSWFGFWSTADADMAKRNKEPTPSSEPPEDSKDVVMGDAPPAKPDDHQSAPTAGSTWAFWSKDSPTRKGKVGEQESGEIAVMGEGSEDHPKPMTEGDVSGPSTADAKAETKVASRSSWRKSKRLRPVSMDTGPQSPSPASTTPTSEQVPSPATEDATKQTPTKVDSSSKSIAESESSTKYPPNLLLPSFSSTYQMKDNPSILKQVANFLLRTSQPPVNHVFRVKEPPKIRKAIAIGVHGLFPATYLRPMIGQPTGTSLRFASLCADAIRKWADDHGCGECEIEKVALEGEGKINERVDNLWKLMLNWIDHIRSADLIIFACHSQGVPISIMLLDKLIDLGIITNAKIGICAMAGVALGPFPEYKSGILMGSAAELWDFGNPQSSNSQRFESSLKRVLDYGARITFIGSIDDQLVPMESAVYSPANHPFIYRAVFIDGRTQAPDFIAHLVGFALKLRNLGISDHGLIRELSMPLAGSLYSGDGHSRLYYDAAVYDLAISHALETIPSSAASPSCEIRHRGNEAVGAAQNPYVLPWIMRGMLEEDFVRTELSSETDELLRQFDDWKPTNKALKDVKYRLEAVRSKL